MADVVLPPREVIVAAYLLHQKDTALMTLAHSRELRYAFMDRYWAMQSAPPVRWASR